MLTHVSTGGDGTHYLGEHYRTEREARWAVFLHDHGETWNYEPDGHPGATSPSYRPQFFLSARGIYLEVRDHSDTRTRRRESRYFPDAPEHCIFLAAGDPPDSKQMRAVGWWDDETRRGVLPLAGGDDWNTLFPAANDAVLAACEAAEDADFELVPRPRAGGRNAPGIPEREREDDQ